MIRVEPSFVLRQYDCMNRIGKVISQAIKEGHWLLSIGQIPLNEEQEQIVAKSIVEKYGKESEKGMASLFPATERGQFLRQPIGTTRIPSLRV